MNEMIDRIIPILRDCDGEHFDVTARKIIEALREPTEAMLSDWPNHVCTPDHGNCAQVYEDDAKENWQRMIDAALKEPALGASTVYEAGYGTPHLKELVDTCKATVPHVCPRDHVGGLADQPLKEDSDGK